MTEIPSPYIPLSWLRHQRKWAKTFLQQERPLDDYDLWIWTVRQEVDRLLILDLHVKLYNLERENQELRGKLLAIIEVYRSNKEYTEYDYDYSE